MGSHDLITLSDDGEMEAIRQVDLAMLGDSERIFKHGWAASTHQN